jgi:hypothetical protein
MHINRIAGGHSNIPAVQRHLRQLGVHHLFAQPSTQSRVAFLEYQRGISTLASAYPVPTHNIRQTIAMEALLILFKKCFNLQYYAFHSTM